MKYRIVTLAMLLATVACKSSKNTAKADDNKTTTTNSSAAADAKPATTLAADEYRFIVSFISFGAGTDFKNIEEFKKYVETYNEMHKKKAVPEIYTWGREGEVDYCFKLADLTTQEVEGFVMGAGKILSKSDRARASRDTKCTHKR